MKTVRRFCLTVGWLSAVGVLAFAGGGMEAPPAPVSGVATAAEIRTPKPGAAPVINSVERFGVRPNHPVFYKIPATGQKPLHYSAKGLPPGVSIHPENGILGGRVSQPGEYPLLLTVQNEVGLANRLFVLSVGESIGLTPVMGWNSWYVWSESVSQAHLLNAARAMVESGLIDYGWSYLNIDDCWQGRRGGEFGAIQPNERFPDIRQMCDAVHAMGLKVGIYSTPWMASYAGFIGSSGWNAEGNPEEKALPPEQRLQPSQWFGRYPGLHHRKLDQVGPYWFGDADSRQWAAWGIDLLKLDWNPIDVPTAERMHRQLRESGRDLILSLSNNASLDTGDGLSKQAEQWRISGDIRDRWPSLLQIVRRAEGWKPFSGPGHFADLDMLQVGRIGVPNTLVQTTRPSGLTPYEQYAQLTYWALFSSPMLLSCDLTQLDDFTLNLLCNNEVNAVNQDALGRQAEKRRSGSREVWLKPLSNGDYAVGIINKAALPCSVEVQNRLLGVEGNWTVRDCWRQKTVGELQTGVRVRLQPHDAALLRIRKQD